MTELLRTKVRTQKKGIFPAVLRQFKSFRGSASMGSMALTALHVNSCQPKMQAYEHIDKQLAHALFQTN